MKKKIEQRKGVASRLVFQITKPFHYKRRLSLAWYCNYAISQSNSVNLISINFSLENKRILLFSKTSMADDYTERMIS